jgi:hypothetical protein
MRVTGGWAVRMRVRGTGGSGGEEGGSAPPCAVASRYTYFWGAWDVPLVGPVASARSSVIAPGAHAWEIARTGAWSLANAEELIACVDILRLSGIVYRFAEHLRDPALVALPPFPYSRRASTTHNLNHLNHSSSSSNGSGGGGGAPLEEACQWNCRVLFHSHTPSPSLYLRVHTALKKLLKVCVCMCCWCLCYFFFVCAWVSYVVHLVCSQLAVSRACSLSNSPTLSLDLSISLLTSLS